MDKFYIFFNLISSIGIAFLSVQIIANEISTTMAWFLGIIITMFLELGLTIIDFIKDWYKLNKNKLQ